VTYVDKKRSDKRKKNISNFNKRRTVIHSLNSE
jgi:hypothetical protein